MSDTADDPEFDGRRVLDKAKTGALRRRMREFVSDRNEADLKELRRAVREGDDLSEIVRADRDERL
ncbi:hypothetical protein [Haloarchaeobius litoreus]|uniref:Uncharacterized protein n=1 Tax=Haloarchaeobius litoreus TaxID=755306 RepID=A0ABD6DP88_9EURY|nr:hypothetical protein [Haloarchaeobius litoreus]